MNSLTQLSAVELREGLREGRITARNIVEATIDRISKRDPEIRAWQFFAPDKIYQQLDELEKRDNKGLLYGIPIGIKDISDTIDMPTTYGSPIYRNHQPTSDAAYVSRLRRAGAIIVGKTVTTEFAYFHPGPTANPVNVKHTPGGSSSGSAAAVADCMVPIASGTQVAGSLARPASYCGLFGYKASFGLHSMGGLKGFSHSLGTLGWMTRSADDLALVHAALTDSSFECTDSEHIPAPKIAMWKTYEWPHVQPATASAIDAAVEDWSASGASIVEIALPDSFAGLLDAQKIIMAYEAAQDLSHEPHNHADDLSESMLALLNTGRHCTYAHYVDAQKLAAECRITYASIMNDFDAMLTPSAPGEAPPGLAATGDPVFTRIWTLLHVPTINVPGYWGPNGLPVGVQLVGHMFDEQKLFQIAKWCRANMPKVN